MSTDAKENKKGREWRTAAHGIPRADNIGLWVGVGTVALGFLFGGTHLVFGAYPLGLALCSSLTGGVWLALIGTLLGSLTLGRSGIIYGLISVLAVFLRVVISGSERREEKGEEQGERGTLRHLLFSGGGSLFGESVMLRVCSALIAGFVAAVYELLLSGISVDGIAFGVSMTILPALFTLIFSGVYLGGASVRELVLGRGRVKLTRGGRISGIAFRIAALSLILFTSLALSRYNLFGIDISYIFATVITLFAAKRFGAPSGAVVGFCSSALVSGLYSAAFALTGAASGLIFGYGAIYALAAGGAVCGIWGAYAGGVSGFLSIFPEYLIGASLMLPAVRYLTCEAKESPDRDKHRRATDMVGTMALAYRSEGASAAHVLENALGAAATDIRKFSPGSAACDSYSVLSRFASDICARADAERELNEQLTSLCEEVFISAGFQDGVIRAFGTSRPYFIMAGEDTDGTMITAPALRESLSAAVGYKLGVPEYFRRDEMVVMQCRAAEKYKLKSALASASGSSGEPSGDTARAFMGANSYAYGLISDGMGSGEEARRTSLFVADFLASTLGTGLGYTTAMHALNSVIRGGAEECSVSVDLFSLDLVGGEACFVKSGAAPSFIKRGDSLYRIRSETVPLGVIKEVDAECIAAKVLEGDKVIMLSDGILAGADECEWLVEFLGKGSELPLADYAKSVVDAAVSHGGGRDDISVLVIEICAA